MIQESPLVVVTVGSSLLALACAGIAWRNREQPTANAFIILMVGLAWWSFAYSVELISIGAVEQLFWEKMTFFGTVVIPSAWFVLCSRYAGRDHWLGDNRLWVLAIEPVVVMVLVWSNEHHHLIIESSQIVQTSGISALQHSHGLAYYGHVAYSYGLVLAGFFLLGSVIFDANRLYRRQATILVAGGTIPFLANISFTLGIGSFNVLDPTPFSFTLTGLIFATALFHYRFLDLLPVARKTLFDQMSDGLVVVDPADRIVDHNSVGKQILGDPDPIGRPLTACLAVDSVASLWGETFELADDGPPNIYEAEITLIQDHRGRQAGRLVTFRDVTSQYDYEQRLAVTNRVLRHNLRNEMTILLGQLRLAQEGKVNDQAAFATMESKIEGLLELSDKARHIQETVARRSDQQPFQLRDCLNDVTASIDSRYPDAVIDTESVPSSVTLKATRREDVVTVFENLIENAIMHNEAATPHVWVSVTQRGVDTIAISVRDDGPGLPEMEREVLEEGDEEPLMHSDGLGLWVVHWLVRGNGGDIEIETSDSGTTITVTLGGQIQSDQS